MENVMQYQIALDSFIRECDANMADYQIEMFFATEAEATPANALATRGTTAVAEPGTNGETKSRNAIQRAIDRLREIVREIIAAIMRAIDNVKEKINVHKANRAKWKNARAPQKGIKVVGDVIETSNYTVEEVVTDIALVNTVINDFNKAVADESVDAEKIRDQIDAVNEKLGKKHRSIKDFFTKARRSKGTESNVGDFDDFFSAAFEAETATADAEGPGNKMINLEVKGQTALAKLSDAGRSMSTIIPKIGSVKDVKRQTLLQKIAAEIMKILDRIKTFIMGIISTVAGFFTSIIKGKGDGNSEGLVAYNGPSPEVG